MKIAVLAANGKLGSLIVKEAVERGNDVTAIAREENKTVAKKFLKKDILDLMDFKPLIDKDLKEMDSRIFKEEKMNLKKM